MMYRHKNIEKRIQSGIQTGTKFRFHRILETQNEEYDGENT